MASILLEWDEYRMIPIKEKLLVENLVLPKMKRGVVKCRICAKEIDIDGYFDHLKNGQFNGVTHNRHFLALNLFYYGSSQPKESMKNVPRVSENTKNCGRYLYRLSNFYRNLTEFILLGKPDHNVGEMSLYGDFVRELNELVCQLRDDVTRRELKKRYDKLLLQPFSRSLIADKFEIKSELGDPFEIEKKYDRTQRRKNLVSYYRSLATKTPIKTAEEIRSELFLKQTEEGVSPEEMPIISYQDHMDLISSIPEPMFNLKCPLTGELIKKPSRGKDCTHASVFCAFSADNLVITSCPICHKMLKLDEVQIDSRLENFYKNYSGKKLEVSNEDIFEFEDNQSLPNLLTPATSRLRPVAVNSTTVDAKLTPAPPYYQNEQAKEEPNYIINLIDPLSKVPSVIQKPARGDKCDHIAVFCSISFENMKNDLIPNRKKSRKCPTCRRKITRLYADEELEAFLNKSVNVKQECIKQENETTNTNYSYDCVKWKLKNNVPKFSVVKSIDAKIELLPSLVGQSFKNCVGARVSLICPLSTNKIEYPAKGKTCDHIEVFCAKYFIKENSKMCPFCEEPIRWENLVLDQEVSNFISAYPKELYFRISKAGKLKSAETKRNSSELPVEEITSKILTKPTEQDGNGFFDFESDEVSIQPNLEDFEVPIDISTRNNKRHYRELTDTIEEDSSTYECASHTGVPKKKHMSHQKSSRYFVEKKPKKTKPKQGILVQQKHNKGDGKPIWMIKRDEGRERRKKREEMERRKNIESTRP